MAGVYYGAPASVHSLRDVGNGGNDTAGSYGFVINAAPDKVILDEAQVNPNPMYPKVDINDERALLAHKGLHAFVDVTWKHNSTSEFRSDIDTVKYICDFAGLYSSNEEPWQLIHKLAYVGVVRNDVLRDKGAAKDNTLDWSAKRTSRNTGNRPIMAGQHVYWDLPPKPDKNGQLDQSRGAALMSDMPANANPAWTMPYDPIIHKGSPTLIKRALGTFPNPDDPDANRFLDQRYPDYGLHRHSTEWIDAVLRSAIVAVASISNTRDLSVMIGAGGLLTKLLAMVKDKNSPDRVRFLQAYLDPLGQAQNSLTLNQSNFIFKTEDAMPKIIPDAEHDRKVNTTGTVFEPNSHIYRTMWGEATGGLDSFADMNSFDKAQPAASSPQKEIVACQLTAAEDMFYFTALVNGFYTNRVIELHLTSSDPGKDYDSVPSGIIGAS